MGKMLLVVLYWFEDPWLSTSIGMASLGVCCAAGVAGASLSRFCCKSRSVPAFVYAPGVTVAVGLLIGIVEFAAKRGWTIVVVLLMCVGIGACFLARNRPLPLGQCGSGTN